MFLFKFFEGLLEPTALAPETPPPSGLAAFYWHYARQARGLVALLFLTGLAVAGLDSTIPVFIGRVVTLVSSHAPGAFVINFNSLRNDLLELFNSLILISHSWYDRNT